MIDPPGQAVFSFGLRLSDCQLQGKAAGIRRLWRITACGRRCAIVSERPT